MAGSRPVPSRFSCMYVFVFLFLNPQILFLRHVCLIKSMMVLLHYVTFQQPVQITAFIADSFVTILAAILKRSPTAAFA